MKTNDMKRLLVLLLCSILVMVSCAKTSDIENLQKQIDDILGTRIASVESQVSSIESSLTTFEQTRESLSGYIEEMKSDIAELQSRPGVDVTALGAAIEAMEKKDVELKGLIDDLKTYVDTGIKDAKDWVSATFATLEQYSVLQSSLSGIRQDVTALQQSLAALDSKLADEIGKVRTDLTAAIGASEISMQGWVNEKLSGYYTIAQTESKLVALKTSSELSDDSLQDEINALEAALAVAKNDLTQAYRAAIEEAILTNDGVVDSKIASAISEAQSALAETISGILSRLDALESRVSALEDQFGAIIAAVQSVVSVPDYTDGSVQIDKVGITDLRFEVFPLTAAGRLAEAGTSVFSLTYVETQTKSATPATIPVSAVSFDGEFLLVAVDGMELDDELKSGTKNISARLCISDGTITKSSAYFPICFAAPELKAVDLGLSVKWASCNLGTNTPEGYGDYYSWGATEPWYEDGYAQSSSPVWKSGRSAGYNWSNVPFCGGTGEFDESYWNVHKSECVDAEGRLLPENDAAYSVLGGFWRMPTIEECEELMNNSSFTAVEDFNGISGRKVTSQVPGFEGKWIFIPASGMRQGGSLLSTGSYGGFWASDFDADYPVSGRGLFFSEYTTMAGSNDRFYGFPIRPVYDDRQAATVSAADIEISSPDPVKINVQTTSDGVVEYESGNTAVATVDAQGYVTPVSPGSASISVKVAGSRNYKPCRTTLTVTVSPAFNFTAVDLGLSVKWASMNLGASSPEEYGGYYQWGGLQDVTDTSIYLDWSNCPYHTGSSSDSASGWTKYVSSYASFCWSGSGSPDNKTVLDPEDDAAHVKLGGKWRMPTVEEWEELMNTSNCSWTWTSINGINGYKVQPKVAGYANNWIFLPAAGERFHDSYYQTDSYYGFYWSSTNDKKGPHNAYGLFFSSRGFEENLKHGRYYGHSVRPVSE